ncbi:MAG: hypothetical protein ACQESG_03660 [Nanobdellota archaeon]
MKRNYLHYITKARIFVATALIIVITVLLRYLNEGFLPIGKLPYQYMTIQNTPSYLLDILPLTPPVLLLMASVSAFLIIILGYSVLTRYIREDMVLVGLILFAMSPVFISMILLPTGTSLALVCLLLAWYLYPHTWLAVLLYALIPLIDFYGGVMAAIVYLPFAKYHKTKKIIPVVLVPGLLLYLYHPFQTFPPRFGITELGAGIGGGAFLLLLVIIGFAHVWEYKRTYWYIFLTLSLTLLLTFFHSYLASYLILGLSIIGAYGFLSIIKRNWALREIKHISLFLLALGLLFSLMSYLNEVKSDPPTDEIAESFRPIAGTAGTVLSDDEYATWIRYFSHKEPAYGHGENTSVFHTRSLERAESFMRQEKVSHVWVHPEMLEGAVWQAPDEGLLFVLSADSFEKIYDQQIQIWSFLAFQQVSQGQTI